MIYWEVQFILFGILIAREILVFYFPAEHLFRKESVSNESGVTNDTSPAPLLKVSLFFSIFFLLCGRTLSCTWNFSSHRLFITNSRRFCFVDY